MSVNQKRFQRTTIITIGLLGFLAGLGLARIWPVLELVWLVPGLAIFLSVIRRRDFVTLLAITIFGLSLGWWRGGQFLLQMKPYGQITRSRVVVEVVAQTDAIYSDGQLSFDGGNVRLLEPTAADLPGRIKVKGRGESAVYRGDVVRVSGSFYPTRGSRQGTMSYADLKVLGRNGSWVETVRREFVAGMETALPEPHASFALGLLIGQRTTLPESLSLGLSAVGLTHIIAVSGYNLTIIVRAVRRFGRKRSKYQMTLLSVCLIGGFVLITGFSASIVRAALVSGLSLWVWYYGRVFRPFLLLILVAAMTAGWSPLYLWSDVGWYLSFLAFFGVLVLVPLLVARVYGTGKHPRPVLFLIYETIAAQLMTAPIIMYIFKEVSLVALISNVLVVPMVPLAMLLSLVAGLAGMLAPAFGGLFAWPATIVLTYTLDIVMLLARLPHALVAHALPLWLMLAIYAVIALACFTLWRQTGVKRDIMLENEE